MLDHGAVTLLLSFTPEQTPQAALYPWCAFCRETACVKVDVWFGDHSLALCMLKGIAHKLHGADLNPGQPQLWWNTKAPSFHLSVSPRTLQPAELTQPQSQACRLSPTFSLFKGQIYRHAKKSEFTISPKYWQSFSLWSSLKEAAVIFIKLLIMDCGTKQFIKFPL